MTVPILWYTQVTKLWFGNKDSYFNKTEESHSISWKKAFRFETFCHRNWTTKPRDKVFHTTDENVALLTVNEDWRSRHFRFDIRGYIEQISLMFRKLDCTVFTLEFHRIFYDLLEFLMMSIRKSDILRKNESLLLRFKSIRSRAIEK